MSNEEVSIAVIDDHPLFRQGVVRALSEEPGFRVVAEGQSAEDAIRIASSDRPDIMILDVSMPGNGLEAARSIIDAAPRTKIMMLTVVDDDGLVAAALQAGAKSYVLKGVSAVDLISTLWSMQRGESFVSPDLAAQILARPTDSDRRMDLLESLPLTAIQRRILSLLAEGRTCAQIARVLCTSPGAVRQHAAEVLSLLQAAPIAGGPRKGLLH